jgi:hypothetical protein
MTTAAANIVRWLLEAFDIFRLGSQLVETDSMVRTRIEESCGS